MMDPQVKMDMIKSALILLVAGMGTTFVFLILQSYVTNLVAFITKPFAHLLPEPEPKKAPKKAAAPAVDEGAIIAAVAAAIHHSGK